MTPSLAKLLVGGLAATVLSAAAIGGAALAQVTPATPTQTPGKSEVGDALLGALANRLGKSSEDVRAAVVGAQKDLVDQAVAAGRLTPEQATRLKQRIHQAGGRGVLRGPNLQTRPVRPAAPPRADASGLSQFLGGVTRQQLGQELRSGKSLAQVAEAHGKTRDQLKTFLTDQARTRLDAQVKAGRLTQERANQMLQAMTANLDKVIDWVAKAPARGTPKAPRGGASL
jgi:polyhydroxyalkanoate synthesis regulator phasin